MKKFLLSLFVLTGCINLFAVPKANKVQKEIVDWTGHDSGKDFPSWVRYAATGDTEALEKAFPGYYVFYRHDEGDNRDFLEAWIDNVDYLNEFLENSKLAIISAIQLSDKTTEEKSKQIVRSYERIKTNESRFNIKIFDKFFITTRMVKPGITKPKSDADYDYSYEVYVVYGAPKAQYDAYFNEVLNN